MCPAERYKRGTEDVLQVQIILCRCADVQVVDVQADLQADAQTDMQADIMQADMQHVHVHAGEDVKMCKRWCKKCKRRCCRCCRCREEEICSGTADAGAEQLAGVQVCRRCAAGVQVCCSRCAGVQQVCMCAAGVQQQVCRCAGWYAGVQIGRWADGQRCRGAEVQRCKGLGPSLSGINLTEKRLGLFGKFPNEPNEPSNEPFGDYRKIFDILDRSFAQ